LTNAALETVEVPIIQATRENTADYGLFIGTDIPNSGLTIPFYKGAVEEGHNIPRLWMRAGGDLAGAPHGYDAALHRPRRPALRHGPRQAARGRAAAHRRRALLRLPSRPRDHAAHGHVAR